LANGQDGLVDRSQLLERGVSLYTIRRWVRTGMLHPRYWGVYAVGHAALAPHGRQRAALLAAGEGAILSHATAAHLWGLRETPPATVDVCVVGRQPRSRPGLRVHRLSHLHPRDMRDRDGLPLTSPARTLIDLAHYVTPDELERLVSEARAQELVKVGELETALERAGHRRGVAKMRAFLDAESEPDFTRSKGERLLRRYLRRAHLSQPRANVRVGRWPVDFLWPEEKLVVEFDGYRFHGHRRPFERDRRKDVELVNAGYLVLRFTWRQLKEEPLVVIAAIAQALGRRRAAA
jgi:very-short-patch-repair endonuclease